MTTTPEDGRDGATEAQAPMPLQAPADDASTGAACYRRIVENVQRVVTGQRESLRLLLAALAGGGHVLLEAMAEGQVSIEGHTHRLEQPFLVIATQNPVEFRGTYPLPEAQMDRFAVRLSFGYLALDDEVAMVAVQAHRSPLDALQACATLDDIVALRGQVAAVQIADELRYYAVEIVRATRNAPSVQLGAGPRASLALMRVAQALALFDGDGFVAPEHVHEAAVPVIGHRLVLDARARFSGVTKAGVVDQVLAAVPVPA